jgi:hypothetical protein
MMYDGCSLRGPNTRTFVITPFRHNHLHKWLIGACRLAVVAARLCTDIGVGSYHRATILSILERMNGQHLDVNVGCRNADWRYRQ